MQRTSQQTRLNATETLLRERLVAGLAGNEKDYLIFLKDLSTHLRAFFRKRLTQLPDDVEDLVQETLLAIHNQRHTYDAAQPLTSWVHAIAKYKFVDFVRRRAGREALSDPFDDESEVFAASAMEAVEARRDILKLLNLLPERQRLPIQHVKLDGLSVVETARITGMSESAIKVGIHRGLKALAAKIGRST